MKIWTTKGEYHLYYCPLCQNPLRQNPLGQRTILIDVHRMSRDEARTSWEAMSRKFKKSAS